MTGTPCPRTCSSKSSRSGDTRTLFSHPVSLSVCAKLLEKLYWDSTHIYSRDSCINRASWLQHQSIFTSPPHTEVRLGTQKAITTAERERDFFAKIAAKHLHFQSILYIILLKHVCSIFSRCLIPWFFLQESQPADRTMLAKRVTYIFTPTAMGFHFLQLPRYRDGATSHLSMRRHLARFLCM